MTLVRFNGTPSAVFPYGNLLNEFLTDLGTVNGGDVRRSSPSVNVAETADAYRLEVAAPGLTKEAFKIHVEDEVLSISSEQPATETEGPKYVRREFGYGIFKRTFRLPKRVNVEGIEARYENGILLVHVPKREETKPRTIQIS
jgi:HSP20 family protein